MKTDMQYFNNPEEYNRKTGKTFTEKCPNIKKPTILNLHIMAYWPNWAEIVAYNNRLYWVNAYEA